MAISGDRKWTQEKDIGKEIRHHLNSTVGASGKLSHAGVKIMIM